MLGQFLLLFILLAVIVYFVKRSRSKSIISSEKYQTIDDEFNERRKRRQDEIDTLLDKIGEQGLDDLSPEERKRLDELSKK